MDDLDKFTIREMVCLVDKDKAERLVEALITRKQTEAYKKGLSEWAESTKTALTEARIDELVRVTNYVNNGKLNTNVPMRSVLDRIEQLKGKEK